MHPLHTSLTIRNIGDRSMFAVVPSVRVDFGAAVTLSWIPASILHTIAVQQQKTQCFETETGKWITRAVGFAVIQSGEFETVDEVVFAEAGDASLLGVRTLEGFNALVDQTSRQLVPGGPKLVAASYN